MWRRFGFVLSSRLPVALLGGVAVATGSVAVASPQPPSLLSPTDHVNDGIGTMLSRESSNPQTPPATDPSDAGPLKVFAGSSNPELAAEIAAHLGIELGEIESSKFADGERSIKVHTNIRGSDVYLIQSTSPPVNEHLVELLLMISTMRRADAKTVTALVPYWGYKRSVGSFPSSSQEKATPLSAADVAKMLETLGVDNVISVELQPPGLGQIEGFFDTNVRVDNVRSIPSAVNHLSKHKLLQNPVVVAATAECVELAHDVRSGLEHRSSGFVPFAAIVKGSKQHGTKASSGGRLSLVGDVKGLDAIIVDDLIDTGETLLESVRLLKTAGARRVLMFATHGLFSKDAIESISGCDDLDEVIVTNTVPLNTDTEVTECHKIAQVSMGPLLATCIRRMHHNKTLQDLRVYDRENVRERYAGQGTW